MKLTFYMKSGSKFTINTVTAWEVTSSGDGITKIHITQNPSLRRIFKKRLIVQSLSLDNIEAIIQH